MSRDYKKIVERIINCPDQPWGKTGELARTIKDVESGKWHSDKYSVYYALRLTVEEISEFDHSDSFRFADIENEEEVKEYGDLITCCGSFDTVIKIKDKTFIFGFNFGH